MASVSDHYDNHLARFYAWSAGGPQEAERRADLELTELNLMRGQPGVVLDLGAGFGPHALAFARRGHRVTAVDGSRELLDQLAQRRGELPVRIACADLVEHVESEQSDCDVVICLGDTLTHLAAEQDVRRLLRGAVARLNPGGRLALTFRDYSTMEPGDHAFILVGATDDRIATCALDCEPGRLLVHDLLHERGADGWQLTVSSYQKLRLDPGDVASELRDLGCTVSHGRTNTRMVALVASKATS